MVVHSTRRQQNRYEWCLFQFWKFAKRYLYRCCNRPRKFASSIYCTTASGAYAFHDTRIMDRWAQLECDSSYSMSMVDEKIIVGCSNGKVQVIDPNSLSSISTVPNPTALPYTEMDEHAAITTSIRQPRILPAMVFNCPSNIHR